MNSSFSSRACLRGVLFGVTLVAGTACKKKEEAPAATVAEAVEEPVVAKAANSAAPAASASAADAGPAAIPVETIALSPANTTVGFYASGATGSHNGTFAKHEGTLTFDPANLAASRVEVTIQIASIKTDSDKLDTHLKSADFFDAAKMPTAIFKSTNLKAGDGVDAKTGGTFTLTGNLELHGVKKSLSFPVKLQVTDDLVDAKADFVLNRKSFKITFDGEADYLIKDTVSLSLRIKAKRHPG